MISNSPYDKYKNNRVWKKIESSLNTLVENKDIVLNVDSEQVIGSIVKNIIEEEGGNQDNHN